MWKSLLVKDILDKKIIWRQSYICHYLLCEFPLVVFGISVLKMTDTVSSIYRTSYSFFGSFSRCTLQHISSRDDESGACYRRRNSLQNFILTFASFQFLLFFFFSLDKNHTMNVYWFPCRNSPLIWSVLPVTLCPKPCRRLQ